MNRIFKSPFSCCYNGLGFVHIHKGKVGCSNPERDRPKSLIQLMTAPRPKARKQV